MAKIIELIYTEKRQGLGKEDDPVRLCPQFFTKDGELVFEYDPVTKITTVNPIAIDKAGGAD